MLHQSRSEALEACLGPILEALTVKGSVWAGEHLGHPRAVERPQATDTGAGDSDDVLNAWFRPHRTHLAEHGWCLRLPDAHPVNKEPSLAVNKHIELVHLRVLLDDVLALESDHRLHLLVQLPDEVVAEVAEDFYVRQVSTETALQSIIPMFLGQGHEAPSHLGELGQRTMNILPGEHTEVADRLASDRGTVSAPKAQCRKLPKAGTRRQLCHHLSGGGPLTMREQEWAYSTHCTRGGALLQETPGWALRFQARASHGDRRSQSPAQLAHLNGASDEKVHLVPRLVLADQDLALGTDALLRHQPQLLGKGGVATLEAFALRELQGIGLHEFHMLLGDL
mmetsp:Transcript_21621/g.47229  ORF Transcript_21621/g.47229 Transcript_21621/m.47229 type:complete len:338 (-) Transcript_21621:1161-2174(-)